MSSVRPNCDDEFSLGSVVVGLEIALDIGAKDKLGPDLEQRAEEAAAVDDSKRQVTRASD